MPRKRKLRLRVDADLIDPSFLEALKSVRAIRVETVGGRAVPDKEILVKANVDDYHIITRNFRDFLKLFKDQTLRIGVLGINTKVSLERITPKITKLLSILGHGDVYHKFYEITNDGCRIHHRRSTKTKFVSWRNIKNVLSN